MLSEVRATLERRFAEAQELFTTQRAEAAEAVAREIVSVEPRARRAWGLLGECLLMQGRYAEAWQFHEQRDHRASNPAHRLPFPEWDGSPLEGRSVLVWGEQGLGDEIQMARFVPRLKELGASRVSLACQQLNVRALAPFADHVFRRDGSEHVVVPNHDVWLLSGSLPFRLGATLKTVSGAPYLRAPQAGYGGIGLVERGNPENSRDAERSIPDGLLRGAIPEGRLLQPAGDILDSLSVVAGLDLLITVDTSWAHMAGALGVPCWVVLPFRKLDWRWMRERTTSPWYDSIRLFRQPAPGDWASVVCAVRGALGELVAHNVRADD